MNPRGIYAYVAGLATLVVAGVSAGLVLLFVLALPGRPGPEGPWLLLVCAVLAFAALHLVAAGLYRMLVHLYHTISRTDPAGDRRLRGRTLYLLGQIAVAMTTPPALVFFFITLADVRLQDRHVEMSVLILLPTGLLLLSSVVAFFAGLGIMVRDLFLRHQEIAEQRDLARRRRLEEPDETQTEILPLRPLADDLRQHIREDR